MPARKNRFTSFMVYIPAWTARRMSARPTAGTNALAALVAAGIAGGMNFHYLPGAAMTAATTWALTFALLQAATAIYKKRRSTLDAAAEDNDDCENENHKEDTHE